MSIITPYNQEQWPIMEMVSKPCGMPLSADDQKIVSEMDKILDELDTEAAGIAAVQVGYAKRLFMLRKDGENTVYINPFIKSKSKEVKTRGEACLSLPGIHVNLERPKSVVLTYYDLRGIQQEETFNNFWARAVCHEMDHLEGKLVSHHLQQLLLDVPKVTKFGMKLTPAKVKQIAHRRAKEKRRRKARRLQRK